MRFQKRHWWIPITVIAICIDLWFLWYFLVGFPTYCLVLATTSQGNSSCSWEPGGYIFAGIFMVILIVLVALILKELFRPGMED